MKIFIFGASGYLGSNLVNYLKDKHEVFACVRTSSSHKLLPYDDSKIITGIEKHENLVNAFKIEKPDLIINTAALYGRKGEGIDKLVDANILFPSRIYELCKEYEVAYFLNTGTSLPDEISSYALTKNTFVKLVKFKPFCAMKFINLELEHFYGPNDDDSKFTSYVIKECIAHRPLKLTSGLQKRDFIYIDDVLFSYLKIIEKIDKFQMFDKISVGSGEAPTIRNLVEIIHSCTKSKSKLEFGSVPMRDKELMNSCADIVRLTELGWKRKYDLYEGINQTILNEKLNSKHR